MRSRIAIFEGYGSPYGGPRKHPKLSSALGRRGYRVDPRYTSHPTKLVQSGYRVKPAKDTAAQKKVQRKFKVCAKKCSRAKSGRFTKCMKVCVRRKKSKR